MSINIKRPETKTILNIGNRCATLSEQDARMLEEILGYDKYGLPTYDIDLSGQNSNFCETVM